MTWSLVHTTTWTGGPVAAVAQMQILQDNWADATGFIHEIDASNHVVATGGGLATPLLRPVSEIARDVLVDLEFYAGSFTLQGVTLRIGEANPADQYNYETVPFFGFELRGSADPADHQVRWSRYLADHSFGYETIHDFSYTGLFVADHTYRLVCSVVGGSITVGSVYLRDVTASLDLIGIGGATVDDIVYVDYTYTPEARLQVPGRVGLASGDFNSATGPVSIYSQPVAAPDFPVARGRS